MAGYTNPYMNAMTQGGALANQTAQTASSFGQNAIKGFDSSASIALKLDQLLMEEENHRDKMLMESQKQLADSVYKQQALALDTYKANSQVDYQNKNLDIQAATQKDNAYYHNESLRLKEESNIAAKNYQSKSLGQDHFKIKASTLQSIMNSPSSTLEDQAMAKDQLMTMFKLPTEKLDASPSTAQLARHSGFTETKGESAAYDAYGNSVPVEHTNSYFTEPKASEAIVSPYASKAVFGTPAADYAKYMIIDPKITAGAYDIIKKDPYLAMNDKAILESKDLGFYNSPFFIGTLNNGTDKAKTKAYQSLEALYSNPSSKPIAMNAIMNIKDDNQKIKMFEQLGDHNTVKIFKNIANADKIAKDNSTNTVSDFSIIVQKNIFSRGLGENQSPVSQQSIERISSAFIKETGQDLVGSSFKLLSSLSRNNLGVMGNTEDYAHLSDDINKFTSKLKLPSGKKISVIEEDYESFNEYTGDNVYGKSVNMTKTMEQFKNLSDKDKAVLNEAVILGASAHANGSMNELDRQAAMLFGLNAAGVLDSKGKNTGFMKFVEGINLF